MVLFNFSLQLPSQMNEYVQDCFLSSLFEVFIAFKARRAVDIESNGYVICCLL